MKGQNYEIEKKQRLSENVKIIQGQIPFDDHMVLMMGGMNFRQEHS